MSKIRIAGYVKHSMVNGPGVRFVLFTQGCPHFCHGCQNPETWSMQGGEEWETSDIVALVKQTGYLDGFTFSGGDPLAQSGSCLLIAQALREEKHIDLWLYTGYTFEEVWAGAAGEDAKKLLQYIDVLVDGRYEEGLKAIEGNCLYRGSTNQRLIDVPKSLQQGTAVEFVL
ncbi:MAG: anaerobic ribonucleoside-triphosphate reductase activating protein [Lachnospiraceae bacterium]|nr:anaerobic ribonucleoside-triphosphate reductase activating protein [Lachnospiraceae bacterium]